MPSNYDIKEVRVTLSDGVTVIATISSIEGIKSLLQALRGEKLLTSAPPTVEHGAVAPLGGAAKLTTKDTPEKRIETRASLEPGSLLKTNLIAFKDNIPQLLRPTSLSTTDVVLILLLAVEVGLNRTKIDYQSFKDLYDAQNIKSGSPLAMKLTDLRNSGYIDKKAYTTDKSILLTAKGERKAIEVIKTQISR